MNTDRTIDENRKQGFTSRRNLLAKLGLAAAAAYTAPVLLQLSEARASSFSGRGSGGGGGRRRTTRRSYSN